MKDFLLITCGGTIDKVYDPISGNLGFRGTLIPDRLRELGVEEVWDHQAPMAVDSLEMSEAQRTSIAEMCRDTEAENILVVHGTDTMVQTAKVIASILPVGKRVVVTGAMVPLSVQGSDGDFHLGLALAHLQGGRDGVFIAMQGKLFYADHCRKDREKGRFVSID